jgi:hypothetical protein
MLLACVGEFAEPSHFHALSLAHRCDDLRTSTLPIGASPRGPVTVRSPSGLERGD